MARFNEDPLEAFWREQDHLSRYGLDHAGPAEAAYKREMVRGADEVHSGPWVRCQDCGARNDPAAAEAHCLLCGEELAA